MTCGSASTVENNAGIHVYLQEGTNLKETIAVQNNI
jgi:hypothetical protein